jgi:hypothetical protein
MDARTSGRLDVGRDRHGVASVAPCSPLQVDGSPGRCSWVLTSLPLCQVSGRPTPRDRGDGGDHGHVAGDGRGAVGAG